MFDAQGVAAFCAGNAETGYRLIYNIESYMRLMLRWELVGAHGSAWRTALGDVENRAQQRQRQESELRLISSDRRNIMSYTLLSELADIIVSEPVWPLFKDAWPRQDLLTADLAVFNAVRAKVAHFRSLTDRDLGAVERFKAIVVDMTAHYRRQKRLSETLDPAENDLPARIRQPVKRWWGDTQREEGRWSRVEVRRLPTYLVVDAQLRSGSFSPSAVSRLVDEAGLDAFFLCLDQGPGALRVYLPLCLSQDEAKRLVEGLYDLRTIGDGVLSDEDDGEAELFDFVMPIEVELPMDFRQ